MRYFIYVEDQLKEVSDGEYDAWCSFEKEKYLLPDYSVLVDGDHYSIETHYMGHVDVDEEPLPFRVLYFEDIFKITDEGLTKTEDNDTIDYYATYEEMVQRRLELIKMIDEKISEGN